MHALDLLLAPVAGNDGWRTVGKQGIRLDYGLYLAPELMPGTRVFCRQDSEDMERLYAFEHESGPFLAEAVCPERAGVDPRQAVAAAREAQAQYIAEATREIRREAKAIKSRDMVDAVLGLAARKANVTAFPGRFEGHSTDALEAAGEAVGAAHVSPSPAASRPPSPASGRGDTPKVVAMPETAKQRFRRALDIRAALDAGREVSADEARWLGGYEQSPEFKAQSAMLEDFGASWLEA